MTINFSAYDLTKRDDVIRLATALGTQFGGEVAGPLARALENEDDRILFFAYLFAHPIGTMGASIGSAASRAVVDKLFAELKDYEQERKGKAH